MTLRVDVARSWADCQKLRDDWSRLAAGKPLASWAWMSSWWRHFGAGREPYVLVARDPQGQVAGIAPWFRERSAANGWAVRFLGSGEVCTDYQSLLTDDGQVDAVARAMADWLSQPQSGTRHDDAWDMLELDGVAAGDPALEQLVARLELAGHAAHRRPGPRCWRIRLPESWPAYLDLLSKSHRKQVRRVERRVIETGRAVMREVTSAEELDEGLANFERLHQARRESLGQEGCFADSAFSQFLREAARALAAERMLALRWLELDGRVVAVDFDLRGADVLYLYQSGIEPSALDEEPGRVLTVLMLQRAIDERLAGFDFLRGDEPYKAHWRAEPVDMVQYRVAGRQALAQLRHRLWLAGSTVKDWMSGKEA